jgi:hypothetical protein
MSKVSEPAGAVSRSLSTRFYVEARPYIIPDNGLRDN